MDENESLQVVAAKTCWNCGSYEHSLAHCREPRNHAVINRARENFMASRGSTSRGPQLRLHQYEALRSQALEFNKKFAPGFVSDDLKDALGFSRHSNDGFPWLYNLLEWGFPPGYSCYQGMLHLSNQTYASLMIGWYRRPATERSRQSEVARSSSSGFSQ